MIYAIDEAPFTGMGRCVKFNTMAEFTASEFHSIANKISGIFYPHKSQPLDCIVSQLDPVHIYVPHSLIYSKTWL
jgi:hypothetical protein